MPNYTVTASVANATRIINALRRKHPQQGGLADRDLFAFDLEGYHRVMVLMDERAQAKNTVVADSDLTEVT